jgi:hypothetical protein
MRTSKTMLAVPIAILALTSMARAAEFADVVQTVQGFGWQKDLGNLCSRFRLDAASCTFKQLSVRDSQAQDHPRAFNVPEQGRELLMFHLRPLVGEFFVVSPQGKLMRAYYRAVGRDYEQLPPHEAEAEFQADLRYWLDNLDRLKQASSGRSAPAPTSPRLGQ